MNAFREAMESDQNRQRNKNKRGCRQIHRSVVTRTPRRSIKHILRSAREAIFGASPRPPRHAPRRKWGVLFIPRKEKTPPVGGVGFVCYEGSLPDEARRPGRQDKGLVQSSKRITTARQLQ